MSTDPTVYVVDDDAAVRDGLALLLDTAGLAVQTYDGAAAFLADWSPGRVGCLILDVRMPDMSGPELADRLRVLRPGVKILFMSGYARDGLEEHRKRGETVHFIQKPLSSKTLAEKVREVLDK